MKKKRIIILTLILLVISLAICILKAIYINPNLIYVRNEELETNKIDTDTEYSIVYFSDLYYGDIVSDENVDNIVSKINSLHPDIILFGGDLIVSNNQNEIETLIEKLSSLESTYGKIAILGDQDYEHEETSKEILSKSGFILLRNEVKRLYLDKYNYINIYGFDSLIQNELSVSSIELDENVYNIALMHEPDSYTYLKDYNFDYYLAGHSLGGQIYIPLISDFSKKEGYETYFKGKYDNKLDITNGVGRVNYNIRFLAKQEIVFYNIVGNKDSN